MNRYLITILSMSILFFTACNKTSKKELTLLQKIKEKKTLDVVILNSPTSYYVGANRELGFEYDLISEYAKAIEVDLNLTIVNTTNEALELSKEDVGDITIASISITEDREKEFLFGPKYYSVKEQLVCHSSLYKKKKMPKKIEDMLGLNIMVGQNTSYEKILQTLATEVEGLEFNTTNEFSSEQLLEMTFKKEIDCTVVDSNIFMLNQRYYRDLVKTIELGDRKNLAFIIRKGDESVNESLYKWLNTYEYSGEKDELTDFYYAFLGVFDYYDTKIFYKRLKNRLPKYKKHFQGAGEKYKLPWMLLAAQSYQESHWNPRAKSYTGVRGMMMITQATAKQIGVKNRLDVKESIYGGAKYLRMLEKRFPPEIKGKTRWAFTLAAYNVGMGHVLDAQKLARKMNKNPYSWKDIKEILPLLTQKKYYRNLKYGYARGNEPVKYVNAIQSYFDIIEKDEVK